MVASESCALDIIGAKLLREVQPGELISLGERGIETRIAVESDRPALCVFEHIYFSRPDTKLEGRTLQSVRGRMGEILAREAPAEADLVISVPDSGNAAAKGFARGSGIPQDDGLIKNRYVARTFIQPGQELRRHGLRMKFNPLPEVVSGKRLVVVDDSIVRGNTMRQIVSMLREAGAKEVHLRMSSPPIRHPCHYGIDMPTSEEMIAHGRTVDEVAAEVQADSLAYLSLEGVYEAVGSGRETHCDACFTGDYPLEGEHAANGKHALEELPLVIAGGLAAGRSVSPIAVLVSGAGTNLQAILDQVHGRDGIEVDVVVSNRPTRRGSSGRGAAGVETAVFEAARLPGPRRARPRDGRLPEGARGPAGGAGRLHAAPRRRVPRRVPAGRDQRPSGAAASLSRRPSDRGPDRLRRENQRRDGPFRGRRRRHRTDHLAGGSNASVHSGR